MNINVFLLFFSFVFLQTERERERVYKIGYKVKRSQSLLIFFLWWSSCGEYFLFYGLIDFMLILILAWRYGFFLSEIFFVFFYPEYLAFGSVHHEPCPTTNFSFLLPLTGRSPHFRFRVPANHFGFSLLPSRVRRPEGGHRVQTSVLNGHSLMACYC